jgi:uncharacterized protein (TIGR02145 family)
MANSYFSSYSQIVKDFDNNLNYLLNEFHVTNQKLQTEHGIITCDLNTALQSAGDDNEQDLYQMNVLPYPKRYAMGSFAPDGFTSACWTADEYVYYTAHYWELRASDNLIKMGNVDKNAGFLIRCIEK